MQLDSPRKPEFTTACQDILLDKHFTQVDWLHEGHLPLFFLSLEQHERLQSCGHSNISAFGVMIVHARVNMEDHKVKVLDHGFIQLVDWMGSDKDIVQAARVSYGDGTKTPSEDRSLIRYLMRHRHTSPFEMAELKFHIKMPIFVARQWIRHRTASINEYSGRYSVMSEDFYVPESTDLKKQSKSNKQGRDEELTLEQQVQIQIRMDSHFLNSSKLYREFLTKDIDLSREIARIVLPLSSYTELIWKIDLHNLLGFLRLRLDDHSQHEIREYAIILAKFVELLFPMTWEAFCDYQIYGAQFSRLEMEILRKLVNLKSIDLESSGLSQREAIDFMNKLTQSDKPKIVTN